MNLLKKIETLFAEQTQSWKLAKENYEALKKVRHRSFSFDGFDVKVQFNPARIISTSAKTTTAELAKRPCFLCENNRPSEQKKIVWRDYDVLVNPFPIADKHFTIVKQMHQPQRINLVMEDFVDLATQLTGYAVFYNGPRCGASAPDHAHFQAGNKGFLPIEKDWRTQIAGKVAGYEQATLWYLNDAPRATLVIESTSKENAVHLFDIIYRSLTVKPGEEEPMMNVLALYEDEKWVVFVFPREKHRPTCYTAEGEANLLSSPASVDLGGVFITPVEKDFLKITAEDVAQILSEVCVNATDFEDIRKRIQEQL